MLELCTGCASTRLTSCDLLAGYKLRARGSTGVTATFLDPVSNLMLVAKEMMKRYTAFMHYMYPWDLDHEDGKSWLMARYL